MTWVTNEGVLADLIRARAEQQPELDVLTFEHLSLDGGATPDEVRTYADLAENANRLAAGLIARGMAKGDRFALMARNHPEFVEAMIAASITATVCVPVDPRTKGDKLAFMLANAGCSGVVCSDSSLEQVAVARERTGGIDWVLAIETGEADAVPIDSLSAAAAEGVEPIAAVLDTPAPTVDVRLELASDPLQIIYTSGTTGDPKGVVFTNDRFGIFAMTGILFGYTEDDRPYTGLSLTHGNAQAVTLASSLAMGLRAVFSRRFTKSKLWDVCRAHGCTTFSLLGGMATAVYSEPPKHNDADNPVRFVISAGMPAAIWENFERRFDLQILEWYGAVEGGLAIKPVGEGPTGSFGKPIPGLEMLVLDEDDQECPAGVVGEICSRPAGGDAEVQYHDNAEASEAKTRGGWLRSGDMGHTDADGWFFFDYRKGGGIRHNGDFVNPGFVEKVLAEHPHVSDVFVYGVEAASGAPGEKDVVAAIVVTDGVELDAESVFGHCREGLESNFVPSYLHVVEEIPKTASEKPQERFLLDAFPADRAAGRVITPAGS
jgi:crotonobetaine/carnitine-CoA ligase